MWMSFIMNKAVCGDHNGSHPLNLIRVGMWVSKGTVFIVQTFRTSLSRGIFCWVLRTSDPLLSG